ncbi:ADP-ribosylglycohydrolase family protein [Lutibacter sp.]|uniref:ADP-ribosylglycohydrolase family protein n=1 Tax=Lutibacter sp. TaxID=1925666 RepID=UPI002734126A|nr:ADP-ribosylglycohydrolase family protein [Lutibacter sp.]MDP3313122.1 ADP-ribosylglycohydrolase family protein [Lutibacter sp.]
MMSSKTKIVKLVIVLTGIFLSEAYSQNSNTKEELSKKSIKMSKTTLQDKIKGGWAGQTIGVVYGAPVEFKYNGSMVDESHIIPWNEHYVKYWWDKKPGLFDDIYTDLNFVAAFEKYGLNASSNDIANHWSTTAYHLAHANQASRYNILNGIMPPASGNWKNNPHADDLDFQIEADFIGLMAPGMINKATEIADRVGHVMNSGDGWYGGVFVAALYSTAFVSNNPEYIVEQAIKTIPKGTKFHSCIADVIKFYKQYPNDWKQTWFEIQKRWNNDVGCPKGVFLGFNIDAKINSAYVAIGLLYGKGDFTKSIDIATRCGQDADCNPGTVGGVLGVMHGYSYIPKFWLSPLQEIEKEDFENTTVSLDKAYGLSFKHALATIEQAGGKTKGNEVSIPLFEPIAVAFEQNFENSFPIERNKIDQSFTDEITLEFNGNGYVVYGNLVKKSKIDVKYIDRISKRTYGSEPLALAEADDPYVALMEIYVDGVLDQTVKLPMMNSARRLEPAWKYQMTEGKHTLKLKWINHNPDYEFRINDLIVYSEKEPTSNLPEETH